MYLKLAFLNTEFLYTSPKGTSHSLRENLKRKWMFYMSKTVQLQRTLISLWGQLLGCWQQWDVLSTEHFIKCVPLSSRITRDLKKQRLRCSVWSSVILIKFCFIIKNLLSLIPRFHFFLTDFLIIIRYTVRKQMKILLFTRHVTSIDRAKKKNSFCSRLVRFQLSIIYSCTRSFILLQHKLESGNS